MSTETSNPSTLFDLIANTRAKKIAVVLPEQKLKII